MTTPIQQDIADLMTCGYTYLPKWNNLFYALKDAILETYGMYDGLDMQKWVDYNDDLGEWEDDDPPVWAEHFHILDRYLYGGHLFHIPTNEFYYFNFGYQIEKKSSAWETYKHKTKNVLEGKKEKRYSANYRETAWRALKRLVARHGHLLRIAPVVHM